MEIRLAAPLQRESIVDGKGIRMVVWNQGCLFKCPGCHNPQTHNTKSGTITTTEVVCNVIKKFAYKHHGITLSGGDPFLQPQANKEIADYAHALGLTVWAYCGSTFEELIQNDNTLQLLKSCDVLVDGPFIQELRDITLPFKGSPNQRTIDVQKSLQKGEVVLYE